MRIGLGENNVHVRVRAWKIYKNNEINGKKTSAGNVVDMGTVCIFCGILSPQKIENKYDLRMQEKKLESDGEKKV